MDEVERKRMLEAVRLYDGIARRAHLARLLGDNPPVATLLPFEDEVTRG